MPKMAIHAFISGRVQGVWFRAFTREQAQKNTVNGWARNLADGRVEVHLEGSITAVEAVLTALHKGPRLANVKALTKEQTNYQHYKNFQIL